MLLTGLLCCSLAVVQAQVVVNFAPVIYGQTLDGLVYAQIINSHSSNLKAKLTIRVRELKAGMVVTIQTPAFFIHPGANTINKSIYGGSRFSFGKNNYGLTLSQTGRFPEGEYEYCFEVDVSESKISQVSPVYENCFVHQLQPMTPLLLIDPVDGDEVCNKQPHFIWQPPVPLPREARHRLVLTEIKDKQDIAGAVTFNPALINQGNIPGNSLPYPPNAPALKEGQRYAWQVVAYVGKSIIARSEVWTFTHKCSENTTIVGTGSYRELKEMNDGNFYIANRLLSFSLNNPYSDGELSYTITSLAEPSKPIKRLPPLKIKAGLNKYDIDLSENNVFKNNQEYLLKVQLQNSRMLVLRFIYKDE